MPRRNQPIAPLKTLLLEIFESGEPEWDYIASTDVSLEGKSDFYPLDSSPQLTATTADIKKGSTEFLFQVAKDSYVLRFLPAITLSSLVKKYPKIATAETVYQEMEHERQPREWNPESWDVTLTRKFVDEVELLSKLPEGNEIATKRIIDRGFQQYAYEFEEDGEHPDGFASYDCLALSHVVRLSRSTADLQDLHEYLVGTAWEQPLGMARSEGFVSRDEYAPVLAKRVFPRTMRYIRLKSQQQYAKMVVLKTAGPFVPAEMVLLMCEYLCDEKAVRDVERGSKANDSRRDGRHVCLRVGATRRDEDWEGEDEDGEGEDEEGDGEEDESRQEEDDMGEDEDNEQDEDEARGAMGDDDIERREDEDAEEDPSREDQEDELEYDEDRCNCILKIVKPSGASLMRYSYL